MRRYFAGLVLGLVVLAAPYAVRRALPEPLPPTPTVEAVTMGDCAPDFDVPPLASDVECWQTLNAVGVSMCPDTMHPEWRKLISPPC